MGPALAPEERKATQSPEESEQTGPSGFPPESITIR